MEKLCITENYQSSQASNLVAQSRILPQNALNFAYMHLQFQELPGAILPDPR
jgi:hypothetical protein